MEHHQASAHGGRSVAGAGIAIGVPLTALVPLAFTRVSIDISGFEPLVALTCSRFSSSGLL